MPLVADLLSALMTASNSIVSERVATEVFSLPSKGLFHVDRCWCIDTVIIISDVRQSRWLVHTTTSTSVRAMLRVTLTWTPEITSYSSSHDTSCSDSHYAFKLLDISLHHVDFGLMEGYPVVILFHLSARYRGTTYI